MKTTLERPLLVSPDEAARVLRVSRSQVYNLIAWGALRTVSIGRGRRILWEDVERVAREGFRHDPLSRR